MLSVFLQMDWGTSFDKYVDTRNVFWLLSEVDVTVLIFGVPQNVLLSERHEVRFLWLFYI